MTMWSGPGRALQAHLDLFEKIDRADQVFQRPFGLPELMGNAHVSQHLKLLSSINMTDDSTGTVLNGEAGVGHKDKPDDLITQVNLSKASNVLARERNMLNVGETHYVSHHVVESVRQAAEQAEPEPLFPTDLPCPYGLMVLEHPFLVPDLDPETGAESEYLRMPIRAIGWAEARVGIPGRGSIPGIELFLYTDEASFQQYYVTSYVQEFGHAGFRYYEGEVADLTKAGKQLGMWLADMTGWGFGEKWETGPQDQHDVPGVVVNSMSLVRRFVLAYWRWCWQRILVPEVHRPNRADARRWKRSNIGIEPTVKVLRLRRLVEAEQRGEDISGWSATSQWIVRGHWRRQHYPSLGPARNEDGSFNHDSHRLVWIEAHLAGNPAGPLKVGHNVTAAVR